MTVASYQNGKKFLPIVFTRNSAFDLDPKKTTGRLKKLKYLRQRQRSWGVKDTQICFVAGKGGFWREDKWMTAEFFQRQKIPRGAVLLSDGAKFLAKDGVKLLEQLGADHHEVFPSAVHQYLSVNDNKWHGVAKQRWREIGLNWKDDVNATLALLHCLSEVPQSQIDSWWEANMGLSKGGMSFDEALAAVGGEKIRLINGSDHYQACLSEYNAYRAPRQSRGQTVYRESPQQLSCDMDGNYWVEY